MIETINKLEQLLKKGLEYVANSSEEELSKKESERKWSKKEILGHLIDSGINNLQRFTEIQFEKKPYQIRNYNQKELIKANDYQNSETNEITDIWCALNNRIIYVMRKQTETSLDYAIELDDDKVSDLRFLMVDYVDHLEYHLNQIMA